MNSNDIESTFKPHNNAISSRIGGYFSNDKQKDRSPASWSFAYTPDAGDIKLLVSNATPSDSETSLQLVATLAMTEINELIQWLTEASKLIQQQNQ